MGLFSRGKAKRDEQVLADEPADGDDTINDTNDDTEATPAEDRELSRALDRSEVPDDTDYLNLGSIWLKGHTGMELRLELDEAQQTITGVTAVVGESAVQLQAFAAPRTEGVWIDIRNEIAEGIVSAGGTAEVLSGEFGEELQTRMPQSDQSGRTVFMPARFIGIDGPRWFLRAVISGRAAIEPAATTELHDLIRTLVIDRGDEAMPPRELLPLRLPEQPEPAADVAAGSADENPDEDADEDVGQAPRLDDLQPFERGPEITEVR